MSDKPWLIYIVQSTDFPLPGTLFVFYWFGFPALLCQCVFPIILDQSLTREHIWWALLSFMVMWGLYSTRYLNVP